MIGKGDETTTDCRCNIFDNTSCNINKQDLVFNNKFMVH